MTRIVKDPEVRRLEIILCAKKLFERKGFDNTSVESIIKEAGIAKGTFYYYFKTKKEILTALVKHIGAEIEDHFKTIAAKDNVSAIDKLKLMFRGDEKKHKSSPVIMEAIHKKENRVLQEQLNILSIETMAPLIADVIVQGNKEGVFNAKTPIESIQLLLAGSLFILDSGLFNWSKQKRCALLKALQTTFEQAVGVKPGVLSFISEDTK